MVLVLNVARYSLRFSLFGKVVYRYLLGCGSFEKRKGFLSQIGILEVDFGNKIKGFQPMIR
jgi:hypothetical protein